MILPPPPSPVGWKPHPGSQIRFLHCPVFECLYEGTRGPGKGLTLATPVLTDAGWKSAGDVTMADRLVAPDGTFTRIAGIFPQGVKPLYRLTFEDGAEVVCDDTHRWLVRSAKNGSRDGWVVRDTAELHRLSSQWVGKKRSARNSFFVPLMDAPAPGLPWSGPDPYLAGQLLGDGTMRSARVTLYSQDEETLAYAAARGWNIYRYAGQVPRAVCPEGDAAPWRALLGSAKADAKAVPTALMQADPAARLAVLRGLMDSDGSIDKQGRCRFVSLSERLARDVQTLARSLGGKASCRYEDRASPKGGCDWRWRVDIQPAGRFNPFLLSRKADRIKPMLGANRRIDSIEPAGEGETVCFAVEHPSHLFVIQDYVVTHNTDALLMSFAQFVGKGFGAAWTGVLFREEYKQLADVVKKSKRWFKKLFPGAEFLKSPVDYKWVFPGGEELLFRVGKDEDDYWDYHGHEYPWIGFEELTNWRSLEFYEMMQSCCRSSQPGMPRMIRATCNPYGRGHAVVKERFQISDDPRQNELLIIQDAQGRERTYVHGDISENTTLAVNDPEYIKTIEGTRDPNRRKAWLLGRWDINIGAFLEGAWKPEKHIVQPFRIPSHWTVWQAMDWGFGKPYAVYWFAKDPEGLTYIWRELYGCALSDDGKLLPNVGVKESPKTVAGRILAREAHDERLGIEVGLRLTGPDLFARGGRQYGTEITHGQTFREEGLSFRPWWAGPGSRKAGAMLVRQMFEEDQVRVFSSCVHWIRTVPTLEPDPEDPDDVDCWVAGTMVSTPQGDVPIEKVRAGDMVDTPIGPRRVLRSYLSGASETTRVTLSDGRVLQGTHHHKIGVQGIGLVPLAALQCDLTPIQRSIGSSWRASLLNIAAWSTRALRGATTTRPTEPSWLMAARPYIDRCGSMPVAQSRRATTSTIGTTTTTITTSTTWNASAPAITLGCTLSSVATACRPRSSIGRSVMRAASSFASMLKRCAPTRQSVNLRADIVEALLLPDTLARSSAGASAVRLLRAISPTAKSAAPRCASSRTAPSKSAPVRIVAVGRCAERMPVYNLTVEEAHLFYANGVLSSNTEGEDHAFDVTKAGLMRRTGTPDAPQKPDEGAAVVLEDGSHTLPNAARPRKD